MELIEGVNIGKLPDIFDELEKERKILRVKSKTTDLNEDYLKFLREITKQQESFREIKEGEIIKGKIFSITPKEIRIDIGYKDFVYIENKVADTKITESLQEGDEIDVVISEINDDPFYIRGSITDLIKLNVGDKLKDCFYENVPLLAFVKEMIPAGFLLDIEMDNVKLDAFMPTTLAGINKLTDYQKDELIGKKTEVMLETLQQDKGIYVVSRRKYLQSLIKDEIKKLKKEFDKNPKKIYNGIVTGTTPFGVFVELKDFNGCLTSMIHRFNINEEWSKTDKWDSIKPGMEISFYIKEIMVKREKIIATQILRESLWDSIRKDKILKGTIIDIKPFGALVKLDDETNGLIQSSYIHKNNVNLKVGEEISVKVISVIKEDRKIYLSVHKE